MYGKPMSDASAATPSASGMPAPRSTAASVEASAYQGWAAATHWR